MISAPPMRFFMFQVGRDLAVMINFICSGVMRWFITEHFVDDLKST